jgi:hypothetical protein
MEHKRSSFWKLSGWGTVVIAALTGIIKITEVLAESTATIRDAKQAYTITLPSMMAEMRVIHEEQNTFQKEQITAHDRIALHDSLGNIFQEEAIKQLRNLNSRTLRIEKKLKLEPIEWNGVDNNTFKNESLRDSIRNMSECKIN